MIATIVRPLARIGAMPPQEDNDAPRGRQWPRNRERDGDDAASHRDVSDVRREFAEKLHTLELKIVTHLGNQDAKLTSIERSQALIGRIGFTLLMVVLTGFAGAVLQLVLKAGPPGG